MQNDDNAKMDKNQIRGIRRAVKASCKFTTPPPPLGDDLILKYNSNIVFILRIYMDDNKQLNKNGV